MFEKSNERSEKPLVKLVVVGHVDHGKSTLIGRLLYDTGALPPEKVAELEAVSLRRGMETEWSFALDAFQAERDQAVTIDSTQVWFSSSQRDYVIIDAPGHREFLKNMISGAADADAGVLVVDAVEGVREQTRRHGYLLHLLGIRQVAIAINKMDLVNYDARRFNEVSLEIRQYLAEIGIEPSIVIPLSGRAGDNIASQSENMRWYDGPTVVAALDQLQPSSRPDSQPLRFSVQDVYKFDARRIIAGRVEAGTLKPGDEVLFSPSNRTAKVRSIESWNRSDTPLEARAGQSIGVTLDEQIFVERGSLGSHVEDAPMLTTVFRATLFWLAQESLTLGKNYSLKLGTQQTSVQIQSITRVIDTDSLAGRDAETVARNAVAEVVVRCRSVVALDEYRDIASCGRFVLVDGYETVAGGVISMEGYPDQRSAFAVRATNITSVDHRVTRVGRATRNQHKGGVIWFTGLSGAGKSTLAMQVEQQLFNRGYHVYVLDGDNVRGGLNANLGFSPEDRTENIRRVGEVASLFADAGMICITAFISPYQADRDRVRSSAGDSFREIYIRADVDTCEQRDPKGLYKKARAGDISEFTGISAPYEAPSSPELLVDTAKNPVDDCVAQIVGYLESEFGIGPAEVVPSIKLVDQR
ncbi:adenylyl-sulfate kinase [Pelagibius sp. Alg239-R121]|uniref:adenylyl-sulfate kinase n=1 Tax=Pelagibius sp. Alg239-R121 TaxID=2993448 RepID=UPI0024A71680|nr:adenylyl-sulfate kinase [Pelagibius sp. Alg239-R121]